MNEKTKRALGALLLAAAAALGGYLAGGSNTEAAAEGPSFPTQTVAAPPAGSTRVIYSLDTKQADKEIIAVIESAEDHVYFAIYTFTLPSIADALVAAKDRGLDVRGLVDSGESGNSYNRPIIEKL